MFSRISTKITERSLEFADFSSELTEYSRAFAESSFEITECLPEYAEFPQVTDIPFEIARSSLEIANRSPETPAFQKRITLSCNC
jgi:hypothetical protein